ncbi:SDR family oxidoreductase [bacterium]|nr:SDR family oxidoreductase [bacterium]
MKYLITGGAGFIGSNIAEKLVKEGEDVRILDNFSTGRRENIAPLLDKIKLIEGDLRDLPAVKEAVKGIDYILHQGAIPSVPRSIASPIESNEANANGTLNLLVAARDEGVKRVVYASSSSVYGDTPELPKREDMRPNPLSPYAVAKLAGEYYCQVFFKIYGLETVCLRYFNVFGPRQDPTSQYAAVVPKFITAILCGKSPTIYGDGLQSRDFTYIENVIKANLLAAQSPEAPGKVYNMACQKRFTLLELIDVLNEILGTKIEPVHADPKPGDVKHSLADITRAKNELGFKVEVDFKEGLKRTIEWMRNK